MFNIKNEERHHAGSFYVEEKGKRIAEMRYLIRHDVMNIYHTEVTPECKGKNIGFELVKTGVNFARENNLKILPTCPFAKKVFDRTPEFKDVLTEEY